MMYEGGGLSYTLNTTRIDMRQYRNLSYIGTRFLLVLNYSVGSYHTFSYVHHHSNDHHEDDEQSRSLIS